MHYTSEDKYLLARDHEAYHVLRMYRHLGLFSAVSYLLRPLNLFPLLKRTHGTGKSATAINPSKLEAHPAPSLVYTIRT